MSSSEPSLSVVQGTLEVLDLPLPEVVDAHVQIDFDNTRCHGNVEARSVSESDWRRLEAPFSGGDASLASWLNSSSRVSLATATLGTCVAGEAVAVDVEICNPLKVRQLQAQHPLIQTAQHTFASTSFVTLCFYRTFL